MKTLAQQLGLWAEQLRDMSAMGIHFTPNIYDQENYQHIQTIAMEMLALATDTALPVLEPLRQTYFTRPCPIPTGDAAVIDDAGKILLIRRANNGLWAMPGGATQVGETPAQAIIRETYEETGIRCQPIRFVGLFDSLLHGAQTAHHLYQFVILCRPLNQNNPDKPLHPQETKGIGWFAQDNLPPDLDPNHVTRIPHAFRVWQGDRTAFFDKDSN